MIRTYEKGPAYFFQRLIVVFLFIVFAFLLGLVPRVVIPVINIPITLQHSAIFFAGSLLGLLGFVSILLFFLLVALGVPLLSGGRGGIDIFLSPSVGFLVGYLLAALVIGILVERHWKTISFFGFFVANFSGLILFYACGISGAVFIASIPFENALKNEVVSISRDILVIVFISFVAQWFKKHYSLIASRSTKTSLLRMQIPTDLKAKLRQK